MTATPCSAKTTTAPAARIFQLLDQTTDLDRRDERGKRHPLALVLTGLVAALCCGRDGNLSRLHRHMVNHFESLMEATQLADHKAISRAQLPILLAKVNGIRFAQLLFDWSGYVLDEDQKRWFALDGKELRGSIQAPHTRGDVCVSAVAHQSGQIVGQIFYCGSKESERPTVSQLLDEACLLDQKVTLDALHMIPMTLTSLHAAGGSYVVGLKANQAHLYRYCICRNLFDKADYEQVDEEKKRHGRLEQRTYRCYSLQPSGLAPRWHTTGLSTLVCVERQGPQGAMAQQAVSYFVSNLQPRSQCEAADLFAAIRQHWCVEVMHHKRDVTLGEDSLRTTKSAVSRLLGSLRTLTINLLEGMKVKNMAAQLDNFADKFPTLIQFLTQQMVL